MFSNYLTISTLLLTAVSAAPIVPRDSCELGTYNCIGGTQYAMCAAGGVWSETMPVPAGMTCQSGISSNPFTPGEGSAPTEPSSAAPSGAPGKKGSQGGESGDASAAPTEAQAAPTSLQPTEAASTGVASTEGAPTETAPAETATADASPTEAAPTEAAPTEAASTAVESSAAPTSEASSPPSATAAASTSEDGGSCGGFPCISTWPSWEDMKAKYVNIMGTSCESNGWGANNSPDETSQVLSAIESLSGSVDQRFVLAIVMQESAGCVRVITTNNGVSNPGLMQDSNGSHSCNGAGGVLNPCPPDQITGMIADGVSGGDDNLTKALATAQGPPNSFPDAEAYAVAARIYNSGSFDISDLNNGLGSTASYVTGVMNRVAGLAL